MRMFGSTEIVYRLNVRFQQKLYSYKISVETSAWVDTVMRSPAYPRALRLLSNQEGRTVQNVLIPLNLRSF